MSSIETPTNTEPDQAPHSPNLPQRSAPVSGLAITCIVLGGASLLALATPFKALAMLPLGFAAVIIGVIALTLRHRPRILSLLGTIFGALAIAIGLASAVVIAAQLGAIDGIAGFGGIGETSEFGDLDPDDSVVLAPEESTVLRFGETHTYADGVTLSVAEPVAYVPSEAAISADQADQIALTFTMTNGSSIGLEPQILPTIASAGVEASEIIDVHPTVPIDHGPMTVLLPGKSATWTQAFSVADADDLVLEVRPNFDFDRLLFTSDAP
ncbi:hypothetical protein HQQ80_11920 [Microbacteriaceae bacterium VKM Ac-2855]|nr:hypothetical protein [Microbacteriaceae bacterium VKM Ac-2855]